MKAARVLDWLTVPHRAYLAGLAVGLLIAGCLLAIDRADRGPRVLRVVCEDAEWTRDDSPEAAYGGESRATCTANDVYGRPVPVVLID